MARQQLLSTLLRRWRDDLGENFNGLAKDPFANGPGRRWDRDFAGEITKRDQQYAAFLVILSIVPALIVAYLSVEPQWKMFAQLFGAPLQAVISGFLTSSLIFLGSHVNRVAKPFSTAFKLMLRIMSIHPLLGFLLVNRYGSVVLLLVYGFFLVRGVRKTYAISFQNIVLFFGVIYVVFALFQLQAIIRPAGPGARTQSFSFVTKSVFPNRT